MSNNLDSNVNLNQDRRKKKITFINEEDQEGKSSSRKSPLKDIQDITYNMSVDELISEKQNQPVEEELNNLQSFKGKETQQLLLVERKELTQKSEQIPKRNQIQVGKPILKKFQISQQKNDTIKNNSQVNLKKSQYSNTSHLNKSQNNLKRMKTFQQKEQQEYLKLLYDEDQDIYSVFDPKLKNLKPLKYYFNIQLYYFKYLIMPVITIVFSILSLVNLVIVSYYTINKISDQNEWWIFQIELAIGIFFILEFVFNILMDFGSIWDRLYKFDRLIEVCNIFEIFWIQFEGDSFGVLPFFKIIRSLRCVKIRNQIRLAKMYIQKYVQNQNEDIVKEDLSFKSDDKLSSFIWLSLWDLCNGIFIEASIILAVNQYRDWVAYFPFEQKGELDYVDASYFIVVSFTTIGYGDIFPQEWLSRLIMVILLVVNITVMSTFLGKFTDLLFMVSSYDDKYDFENHIVLIGEYPDYWVSDFLAEMVELDLVYKNDEYKTKQSEKAVKKSNNQIGTKVILVGKENPNSTLRSIISYYQNSFDYDNEITYLHQDIYSSNKSWYDKASLSKAKCILGVSLKYCESEYDKLEEDKKISLSVKQIKEHLPNSNITLVLQSDIAFNFQEDSMFNGIKIYKNRELSEYILGSSLENKGFGTILTHVLTMQQKSLPQIIDPDSLFSRYIQEMEQEIYQYIFPPFLFGKTFKEAFEFLYLYSLQLKDDKDYSYIGSELFRTKSQDLKNHNDKGLLLLAVEINSVNDEQNEVNNQTYRTIINPVNYVIQPGDIGYVLTYDNNHLNRAYQISSQNSKDYLNMIKNKRIINNYFFDSVKSSGFIKEMYDQLIEKNADYLIKNKNNSEKNQNDIIEIKRNSIKSIHNINHDNLQNQKIFDNLFVLDNSSLVSPFGMFENHFVIFGKIESQRNIIKIVRKYSNRPILIFSSDDLNNFVWDQIQEYQNIYLVQGNYLDLSHLSQLNLEKTYKILILSDKNGNLINDQDAITITKIIVDHFKCSNFLTELQDEANIKFIGINPRKKNFLKKDSHKLEEVKLHSDNDEAACYFWSSFVQGNVFFSSILTTALARQIYNPNWLYFLKDLIIPKSYNNALSTQNSELEFKMKKNPSIENQMASFKSQVSTKENKMVNSLRLTQESAQYFKIYGFLQFALMNNSPQIISLGLIKNQVSNQEKYECSDFVKVQSKNSNYQYEQLNKTLNKLGQFQVVLTNPSFYTPLEQDDEIIVLGINKELDDQFQEGLSMNDIAQKKEENQANILENTQKQQANQLQGELNYVQGSNINQDAIKEISQLEQIQVQSWLDGKINELNLIQNKEVLKQTKLENLELNKQKEKGKIKFKNLENSKKYLNRQEAQERLIYKKRLIDLIQQNNQLLSLWSQKK